jgi:restriction endonuclease Mrr
MDETNIFPELAGDIYAFYFPLTVKSFISLSFTVFIVYAIIQIIYRAFITAYWLLHDIITTIYRLIYNIVHATLYLVYIFTIGPFVWLYKKISTQYHIKRRNELIKQRENQLDLYYKTIELESIDIMTGKEFEKYVCRLFKSTGLKARVTKGSNDLGVDIVAEDSEDRIAVQVKCYSSKVSRRAISDAVGAMSHYNCNRSMVITNNYFTKGAIELAHSNKCMLVDRDLLAEWIYELQNQ